MIFCMCAYAMRMRQKKGGNDNSFLFPFSINFSCFRGNDENFIMKICEKKVVFFS